MSTEPTTEMMNEAICTFMGGYRKIERQDYFINVYKGPDEIEWQTGKYLKFHTSWDWLMPVVEKIEALENKRFGVCIDVLDTMIMDYDVGVEEGEKIILQTDIYPDNGDTKISITHAAVYQFITWFNQQKQTNADGTPT